MCSKFFAATKQIEEELLLLLWFFLREKEGKKRNEMKVPNERKKAKRDPKSR